MLRRMRAAALVLAMGAGTLVLATPASATAKAPTISPVAVSPASPIVVFDKPVTATFSFTTKDAGKAELQLKPPGASVGGQVALTPKPFGQWTKWTGTKTFEAANAGQWSFLAIAHGDGEKSVNGTLEVRKALDTKIVDFDANPDLVDRGDRIRVSARLLADGKGYGGKSVTITFRAKGTDAYRHVAKSTTAANGWFSAHVKAEATGWWRAEYGGDAFARSSVSDTDRVDVKRRDRDSRIVGFDAHPEPVDKGDKLTFTGALQAEGWRSLPGQRVNIVFKAPGTDRWQWVASDVTGRDGRFWASTTAETSGWWRAEYAGTKGINGSAGGPDWVRVVQPTPPPVQVDKADTRLIKFNAYPEPVKRGKYVKFRGKLQVDDEGSWEGYSGKVRLYFKPAGSHKWQYVKSTWSNDSGKVYTKVKGWKSGWWKLVFRGDDDTWGDTSRRDYVRVKR